MRFRKSQRLTKVDFRDLSATARQADYILITDTSLRTGTYPYLTRRHGEGLSILVAPIDDIYNEFSYGIREEGAIKQFLGYAFHHWQEPPPRYVLLAGNGSQDPLNNHGVNDDEIIPVHMGITGYMFTSLDGWYVAVNGGDLLPDIALGRIPAEDLGAVQSVYDKIVASEEASTNSIWRTEMVFAADAEPASGGLSFKNIAEYYRTSILEPNGFTVHQAYVDDHGGSDAVTQPFIINPITAEEVGWVSYYGYGSPGRWSSSLFDRSTIASLNNTNVFPVFHRFRFLRKWFV